MRVTKGRIWSRGLRRGRLGSLGCMGLLGLGFWIVEGGRRVGFEGLLREQEMAQSEWPGLGTP